jgi:hypothetical protein
MQDKYGIEHGSSYPLFALRRLLELDKSIDLLSVNADVARRIDADGNLVAVHAEDREGDIRGRS